MKFVAIYFLSEYSGVDLLVGPEGKRFFHESSDCTNLSRAVYRFLKEEEFPIGEDGRIQCLMFGLIQEELVFLPTFFKYMNPIGGIHNPYLLSLTRSFEPVKELVKEKGVMAIYAAVQNFYTKGPNRGKK